MSANSGGAGDNPLPATRVGPSRSSWAAAGALVGMLAGWHAQTGTTTAAVGGSDTLTTTFLLYGCELFVHHDTGADSTAAAVAVQCRMWAIELPFILAGALAALSGRSVWTWWGRARQAEPGAAADGGGM